MLERAGGVTATFVEKASIDEVYVDVTKAAHALLVQRWRRCGDAKSSLPSDKESAIQTPPRRQQQEGVVESPPGEHQVQDHHPEQEQEQQQEEEGRGGDGEGSGHGHGDWERERELGEGGGALPGKECGKIVETPAVQECQQHHRQADDTQQQLKKNEEEWEEGREGEGKAGVELEGGKDGVSHGEDRQQEVTMRWEDIGRGGWPEVMAHTVGTHVRIVLLCFFWICFWKLRARKGESEGFFFVVVAGGGGGDNGRG